MNLRTRRRIRHLKLKNIFYFYWSSPVEHNWIQIKDDMTEHFCLTLDFTVRLKMYLDNLFDKKFVLIMEGDSNDSTRNFNLNREISL